MTDIKDILTELSLLDIKLNVVEGNIDIMVPKNGTLPQELLLKIKDNKPRLMTYIESLQKQRFSEIPQLPAKERYEASSAQKRLWVLSQLEDASVAYHISVLYRFEGELNIAAFREAFETISKRHESLRTVFTTDEQGEVFQVILPEDQFKFTLELEDLRNQDIMDEQLNEKINSYAAAPFNTATGPLMRGTLYRMNDQVHLFSFTIHHLISDAWSLNVFVRELLSLYNACKKGEKNPLASLRIQYKEYAAWQQKQLGTGTANEHKAYWLGQFGGELPVLELHGQKKRPGVKTYNGSIFKYYFKNSLHKELSAFSQKNGGTLFIGLMAGVKALLYKYTGQEDIILGTPVAGRDHTDLEEQIGFYINTLAVRTRFKGKETFAELFGHVKATSLGAFDHQLFPLEELIEELSIARDRSRSPLFDIMIGLQNAEPDPAAGQPIELDGLVVSSSENTVVTSKFDLIFNFYEEEGRLGLSLEYNTDIYSAAFAEQLSKHLEAVITIALEEPGLSLDRLDFLSEQEKQLQLSGFNPGFTDHSGRSIVQLFEEQVKAHPKKTALVFEDTELSYSLLNKLSDQFAHYLSEVYKVGMEDLVCIKLKRDEWLMVAILGILKNGAAYLPIDMEYPADRIDYILEDSGCTTVIDEKVLKEFINTKGKYSGLPVKAAITPATLAYVIYTSGTTGRPKGVLIEHKSVVRLVRDTNYIQLDSTNVLLATGAATFDSVTFEYWGMLLNGGKLVLAAKEELMQAYSMKFLIEEHRVNTMWLTSSWFNEIVAEDKTVFKGLKTLLVGGDRLSAPHINSLMDAYPGITLVNGYGPTENTTFSLCHQIRERYEHEIPIGKPVTNSTAYILNVHKALLPLGACGEIYVGGDGLARGYLNRHELTEKKFTEHPFRKGEKLYRTGDLGRWRADGTMEFMGRLDNQVKVRGFRIELGEIENTVLGFKKIEQAVIMITDSHPEKSILCYFVCTSSLDIQELRNYLKTKLPGYMIPAHFIQLDKMPLTPNGKIDKRALPAPEGIRIGGRAEYIAPRNKTEEQIAALWSSVLGIEKIGVQDDFFELGGHSLRGIRLINLYEKELHVKFTIGQLFEHTTLEKHAALITSSEKVAHSLITKAPDQELYPLSSAQKRLLFLQEFAPGSASYNVTDINFLGKEADKRRIESVIKKLIARHESLRTAFVKKEGIAYQKILDTVPFELDEHECGPGEAKAFIDAYVRPFDLSEAPLLRSALLNIKGTGYLWIVDLHHIITDGTSQEVLVDDFFKLYNGEELPGLKLQYRDFSEWQNKMIENGELDHQKEYWQKQLSGDLPVLNLPSVHARPAVFSFEGGMYEFSLNAKRSAALYELGKRFGGTLQISILSLLNVLFHKCSGADDIVVGCSIAGRRHSDLERIMGMFVNALPVRNFPRGDKRFSDLYAEVKTGNLAAYENQDIQFEDLVNFIQVKRDPSRNPVFDISLVIQNFEKAEKHRDNELYKMSQSPGLLDQLSPEWNTSKFDMTWSVVENEGQVSFNLEYYAAIFNKAAILDFVKHFETILDSVIAEPDILLDHITLLKADEEKNILEHFVNGEPMAYDSESTLHKVFEEQVKRTPGKTAVHFGNETYTYKELDTKANRLAEFLNADLHLAQDARIGILQRRSKELPVSLMATLKAGCAYVPLDVDYPEERLLYMLEDAGIEVLLTEKNLVEFANRLQWRSPRLKHIVCVDSENYFSERGGIRNELMEKDLWDHVGRTAKDAITGGGWMSSYTGEDLSVLEMKEYSENAYLKLKKYLHPGMKVLEIGCSSGLTMFRIAEHVGTYYGTDLSGEILANTQAEAKQRGLENIHLHCIPANEIDRLGTSGFDLVIINSVIHCFEGHNYLRDVLVKAAALMKEKGMLFLGDLMDEDKRNELINDLVDFKKKHPKKGLRTKTDWSAELFVSRTYLDDLAADGIGITDREFSEKIHTVSNELTKFRYDALLHIDKKESTAVNNKKQKHQHDLREISKKSGRTPGIAVKGSGLAYVIYTSGSTGNPKGVMVEHRSILNYIAWSHKNYNDGTAEDVKFGLFTSLSFDLTVTSIYMPLLTGGTLRIYDPAAELMDTLKMYMHEQSTENFIKLTPSHIRLLESMQLEKTKIKYAIAGGEELRLNHIRALQKLNPEMHIYNEYGPTETTVGCIAWKAGNEESNVLIGRPAANTSVYILNTSGKIVPTGTAGEICIGGDGLARGYLNRADLTAEKFIANPYKAGTLIYKTGDLGRFLRNGEIEYLGRKDDQVKIRGYRMELGEITRVLASVTSVKDATVIIRELQEDEKVLVAYLVTEEGADMEFIRESLKELLPLNMIPSYFVQMPALPLTVNGKIDKRALPDPVITGTDEDYLAPSDEMEEAVLKIWQRVLGKSQIGANMDFFALGGHSLKVMKLISLYEKELKVKLSLSVLFEHRTIQSHAVLIKNSAMTNHSNIGKAPEKEFYHLSSAQKRLYFLHELTPGSTSYNMPVVEYLGTEVEKHKIEAALKKLITRHESLRTSYWKINGVAYQKIHEAVDYQLDYHECAISDFRDYVNAYIRPFDLNKAPLIRTALVKVEGLGFALIVDEHHIISDGVSHELLVREFMNLYQGEELPELRLQYKDYSEWQNGLLLSGELDKQRKYWEERFAGGIPKLNMPVDRQRPAVFNFEGDRIAFTLDKETSGKLHNLGNIYGGTLQMTLLSVLNTLLYKYTNQEDVVVGCGIAGRHHADLEGIYGMFVNSLAIRSYPAGNKSFGQLYGDVKEGCLSAYDNQDLQFDDLVDLLKIERDPSRNPVFDVLLVVQNYDQFEAASALTFGLPGNVDSEQLQNEFTYVNKTAKFDLTFHIWEISNEIYVSIEYYSAIFDRSTIERFGSHFRQVIKEVLDDPDVLLADVNILPEKERRYILENFVNGPVKKYPADASVHSLFSEQVLRTPESIAVTDETGTLTYKELEKRSDQLAGFLYKELMLTAESKVGVLQARNNNLVISFLGILKAGGAYVPLDLEFPAERLLYMIEDAGMEILLIEKSVAGLANHLLWRSKSLKHIVCIDSEDVLKENGGINNQLMQKDLWDHVGDKAVDSITAGGWLSSYTGEPISEEEMKEYSDNAFLKLKPHLHKDMKVLEIGCSSGLTMFQVAPDVKSYHGTDLSSSILARTQAEAKERGQQNIFLTCMPAHEIHLLDEKEFDLVIINSVIQCFEGHNYLRDVLEKATALLKDEGLLFLGDLMNEDRRQELIDDLKKFKDENHDKNYKTKTDWSNELFVSENYFRDLADDLSIVDMDFSNKIFTIPNELTLFRYDALLKVDKAVAAKSQPKHKQQHDLKAILGSSGSFKKPQVGPDSLCYVMYTSGSTGHPKGVLIEHAGVIRLVKDPGFVSLDPLSVLLATGATTFDAITFEYWGMLLNGGKLVLVSKNTLLDPHSLKSIISNEKVNTMWFTAGWLNELVDNDPEIVAGLTYLLAGGDKLSVKHIAKLKNLYPDLKIINGYGPTENTTFSLTCLITDTNVESFPIGKPLNNSSVLILDQKNNIQPIGVPGEIILGGKGLAREYQNRPGLNAEKFFISPYNTSEKLYRSGDLGRWLPDGNVEFIGRKDDQVKIRGYRIELGEIENSLLSKAYIENAVVLVENKEEKQLVAYIIPAFDGLDTTIIATDLAETLPDYMIPSRFVKLTSFPLTANGKVDRNALAVSGQEQQPESGYVMPSAGLEQEMVLIWQDVLGVSPIGITDDFFKIGGHSLKAISLVSSYSKKFNAKIPLKDIFEKTTIAEQALLIKNAAQEAYEQIPAAAQQQNYPLSNGQRRLWVLSQFNGGSAAYNMPFSTDLHGGYNMDHFIKAIHSVIDRHEILRTVFKEDNNREIRQWICTQEELDFSIEFADLREDENRFKNAQDYIEKDSVIEFDLERGPLFRACIMQMEEEHYVFYFNMHHIISDGISLEVMSKDILHFYNAYRDNTNAVKAPLRIQYKDYAVWQLGLQKEESYKKHKEYWLGKLAGELPVLDLPSAKKRPLVKTYNGMAAGTFLTEDTTRSLKEFCKARGGSLFMGLIASMKSLFYRYTGQEDLIIGTPVAGREHKDLEEQIGFYVNTLILRNNINGTENFNTLFNKIKGNVIDAFGHQSYAYDQLLDELNIKRDTGRNPLFDVMVSLANVGGDVVSRSFDPDSVHRIVEYGSVMSRFDMEISFQEVGNHLSFNIEYNTDVFEKADVERLMKHYKKLLEEMLTFPDAVIDTLDLLDAEEREKLLLNFNDTARPYPKDKTLIGLFKENVNAYPDQAAVICGEKILSYQQLDILSDSMARYLNSESGIRKEDRVVICISRSEWMVVSILGILKSGAAYVPVDPEYPADRISYIKEDSGSKLMIDDDFIEKFKAASSRYPAEAIDTDTDDSQLAYVIYTSGSTGTPKGVMVEQRSVCAFAASMKENLYFEAGKKVAFATNITFDISVLEVLGSLCNGCTVTVFNRNETADPSLFLDRVIDSGINILQLTPSRLTQLSDIIDRLPETLELMLIGGEALTGQQYKRLKASGKYTKINVYGPTETTIWSSCLELGSSVSLSIGKPLSNEQIYILNKENKLCPVGIPGEICIAGAGLARGYINQPELTAQKFIDHPFKKNERLYKTGDIGRWLADGCIEYTGRADNQVKIRGYRIEPGEIENALLKRESVEAAIVMVRENNKGEKMLLAYLVSTEKENAAALRSSLKNFLPDYMIPEHFIQMDKIPLTPNGKVDKKALSESSGAMLSGAEEYTAAGNETENILVEIWEELLERNGIGVKDNFFEIGGHSLKAIQLLSVIALKLKKRISLSMFYSLSTIERIAEYIHNNELSGNMSGLLALNDVDETKPQMILVPPITGNPIVFRDFSAAMNDSFNCYGFDYAETSVIAYTYHSIREMAKGLIESILSENFRKDEKMIVLGYSMGGIIAFEAIRLLEEKGFSCALILIDQVPNVKGLVGQLKSHNEEEMDEYVKMMMELIYGPDFKGRDLPELRSTLAHHLKMLDQHYTSSGKIRADILSIEATKGFNTGKMSIWKKYTSAKNKVEIIDSDHYRVFMDDNITHLKAIIKKQEYFANTRKKMQTSGDTVQQ